MGRRESTIFGFSRNVFFLGLTSLFNDISSEMIYPLVPIFLTTVLGAPVALVGLIEGIAESTASIMKLVSGWLSDRFQNRKRLTVAGYTLSAVTKPLLSLSLFWWQVLGARLFDRLGKGIRTAPRDALIADSSNSDVYGRSFGFHRAMDTVGAAIGPLLAFSLFPLLGRNFRLYFALALIPAVISVALLVRTVIEPRHKTIIEHPLLSLKSFERDFKLFLAIILLFTIGNSSDAFLILRAQNVGVPISLIPLVYLTFNLVNALMATPAGIASDHIGRRVIIGLGLFIFSATYFGFARATGPVTVWLLFALYGMYYAFTEGIFKAYAADFAPPGLRGVAYGMLNLVLGIALLPASLIAGALWQYVSPSAAFYYGAATSFAALILFVAVSPKPRDER